MGGRGRAAGGRCPGWAAGTGWAGAGGRTASPGAVGPPGTVASPAGTAARWGALGPGPAGAGALGATCVAGALGAAGATGAACAAGATGAAGALGTAGAAGATGAACAAGALGAAGATGAGRGIAVAAGRAASAVTSDAGRLVTSLLPPDRRGVVGPPGAGSPAAGATGAAEDGSSAGDGRSSPEVALAAAFFVVPDAFRAGLDAGSSGCTGRRSPSRSALRRARSACASSMEDEWLFTPIPRDRQRSSASLFVRPSSWASS